MENNTHIKTLAFCTTIICAVCAIFWDKAALITTLFVILTGLAFYKKLFGKIFVSILIATFGLSMYYAYIRQPAEDLLYFYNGQNISIKGFVSSLPDQNSQDKTRFVFDVNSIVDTQGREKELFAKTQTILDKNIKEKFKRGDALEMEVFIKTPEEPANPGEFDYGKYLANNNIYTISYAKEVKHIENSPDFGIQILRNIDNIREKIISIHSEYLNSEKTQILGGVVFGSEAIKPASELKTTFINSGLYHLLAASGMNVAFIFGIWFFLLIRLKVPYRLIIISGGIVVLFYAMMTGLPPSVTRATWMLELGLIAKLLDRKADNSVILVFVCSILLLYDPKLINDIGFLLSFMVTFGLLTCTNPIMEKIKFLSPRISSWFVVPFIAQVFAMPIQIYFFQTISVYSIIANILVIPFMAIISFCGFVASIFALIPKIGIYLCLILDKINEPFLTFMLLVAKWISFLPHNIAHVAKLNYIEIILYYILVFLFIYMLKNNFKDIKTDIASIIVLICLIFSLSAKGYSSDLTFTFLNVGEADSIFITTPNNKHILVDAGRTYSKNANSGTSIILPFLKTQGINSLDIMLLTHPDSDHIGGSVNILENIKVDTLVTNGETANNKTYLRLKELIKTTGQKEKVINKPENISPDETVSIIAFKPPDTKKNSQNDTSIILLFKYKDFDAILMGDNETNSFEELKQNLHPSGEVELFKLGHHGSKNSINSKMAKLISPSVSVISVGENAYGHPHPKAISTLRGSRIYRTDMDNTVRIKTNGKNFDVYTFNPEKQVWKKDTRQSQASSDLIKSKISSKRDLSYK